MAMLTMVFGLVLPETPTFAAEGQNLRLVDEAGLLSGSEVSELTKLLDEISTRQKVDVIVYIQNEPISVSAQAAADDYFDYNGFGIGAEHDGILLYINMKTRDWSISTCGYGITAFTDEGLEYITDRIVPMLSDEEYYDAVKAYSQLSDEFISQAKKGKPYDVGHMPKGKYPFIKYLGIAAAVGLLAGGLYTFYLWSKLKSVAPNNKARDYVVKNSMNITEARDIYLYRTVTATPKESSSSGGSSTHSSSSGSTHGGASGKF